MPHSPLNPDLPQRWRLRNPCSGREVVLRAGPGIHYVDRESGEAGLVVLAVLEQHGLAPLGRVGRVRDAAGTLPLLVGHFLQQVRPTSRRRRFENPSAAGRAAKPP